MFEETERFNRHDCQRNALDARRRQKKERELKEDMAKYIQRRHGTDGCQLAWSLQDRHGPTQMETSRRPMHQEEQDDLSLSHLLA